MKAYPAVDVRGADSNLLLAVVDDYSPTAVEERDGSLTIYFSDSMLRNRATEAVARAFPTAQVSTRDVDDEDWARRSQEHLGPVTVGRVAIIPHSEFLILNCDCHIVIPPSMAFGTGHHATTRLCLAALQTLELTDAFVLDVGTGSGVLAIAARMLGARQALGIDNDPDAVQCARDNLALNPDVDGVTFEVADIAESAGTARPAGVIMANLTGALLCRAAPTLGGTLTPGGRLVVSGVLSDERDDVLVAFGKLRLLWEQEEEGWVGLIFEDLRERQLEAGQ